MIVKLGYLCSSMSWGGLEMNHLRNAVWMQQRGHDVVFLCRAGSRLESEAKANGLRVLTIESHRKYYDFKKAKKLVEVIKAESITHLLIRSTFDISVSAIVKRKMKENIHTSYFMEMQMGVKKTNVLHTLRFKYIDLWSCPLPWLEKQVQTMTRYSNKLVVIPSGIDLHKFADLPTQNEARKMLELPEKQLIFGLVGRFDEQKGQLLLLEAMQHAKNKEFNIALVGEPTLHEETGYFERMQKAIDEFNLNERVHIRPFMKNIEVFYCALDWFVMATKKETVGMVTIESLACGTPVLGSNAGGTPELLEDERGGVLFETMSAKDMAQQIDRIIDNQISRESKELKLMARKYDHIEVCEAIEQELEIS